MINSKTRQDNKKEWLVNRHFSIDRQQKITTSFE